FWSERDSALKKVAVSGGPPVTLCKAGFPLGVNWDGNVIVFGQAFKGIMRVSEDGGEPQVIAPVNSPEIAYGPQLLDGGRTVLFTLGNIFAQLGLESWDKAQIVVQSLASGKRKVVISGGSDGRYLPTGHLVYAFGSTVMGVPFDVKTHEIHGARIPVLEGITRSPVGTTAATDFVISDDGTLAYIPGTALTDSARRRTLAVVDRTGKSQTLQLPAQTYLHPRVLHDGKQVVFASDDGKDAIIWIYDLKGSSPPRRLTFGGRNLYPIWHPDGRHI